MHPKTRISFVLAALFISLPLFAAEPSAAPAVAASTTNLLKPFTQTKAWEFEINEDAKGTMKTENGAIALAVNKVDGVDWHVQLYQAGIDLNEGKDYLVTFKARADAKRAALVYAGVNEEDFHSVGLDEPFDLTPAWTEYKFTFKAEGVVPKNNRLGFIVGQQTGTVYIKDLVLSAK